jgi:protein-S-isoprenylcysteine O-methyltransferase Ste14
MKDTPLNKIDKTSISTYLLALLATLSFTYLSLKFPQLLTQLRYSTTIWRRIYAKRILISVLPIFPLFYFYYSLKRKNYSRSALSSMMYFMPTFMIYLIGMAFTFTGIEVISYTICKILFRFGSEAIFFDTILSRIYYIGEFFYIPYWLFIFLLWPGQDWYGIRPLRDQYGAFFILLGALVMFLGIAAWLDGKRKKFDLVTQGVYQLIRHPQYLGFILWGYGVLVYSTHRQAPFHHPLMPTFNWVLSSLMLIGLALVEEMELRKAYPQYKVYARKVSFFVPLLGVVRGIVARPWKALWKGEYPSTYRMVLVTFSLLFVLLLLPGLLFGHLYDYEVFRQYAKIIKLPY